ncbi:MAG: pilus assembly protein PilC [Candidatus Cloacimonadota bacterium]|nr:MAG: pilus assembly protein PilC [Candidatus Cloacimonadota bacterium]
MATFAYIVKDAKGARAEGVIKAGTIDEAVEKLTGEGHTIIAVKSAESGAFSGNMSLVDKMMLSIHKFRNRIPLKILVFFTRQLSTMFSAGLTLEKSIADLGKAETHPRFKKVLLKISDDIKKGYSLSEAMEQHPGVFNNLYISLVKAGEASGTLHTVLDELSDYLEKIEDTRRKVGSAMAYPIFIIVVLAVVIWALFYFVIPQFEGVYNRFNADLPLATQAAIKLSNILRANVLGVIFALIVAGVVFWVTKLTDRGRYFFDMLLLKIPYIGELVRNSIMSKFARTFSILMTAGVPIMDTMALTENVVQNAVVESAIRKTRVMVKEGYSIAGAFGKTGVFPSTMLQLTATGEETGDMDRLLAKAAEFYEKLVDSVVDRLTSLIEPMLIIIMAVVVGGTIIVIYLPIFQLGSAISSGIK